MKRRRQQWLLLFCLCLLPNSYLWSMLDAMYQTVYHDKSIHKLHFLVTGGAGFIGSNLVAYLLRHGAARVRVLDNLLTGDRQRLQAYEGLPNFEFIEGDIRSQATCRQACEGMDIVSHQAALGAIPRSVHDPVTTHDINAGGFVNMLMAARDAAVSRFVFASSSSVYGDDLTLPKRENQIGRQLSPYAVSKYTNELYAHVFAELYQLKLIGLRYFNVFGPYQDPQGPYAAVVPLFIQQMLEGKQPAIHGDGSQTRDFTYVENVVQANVKAMLTEREEAFGEIFNVAYGQQYSVLALFDAIQKRLGSQLEPLFKPQRPADIPHSWADISKAKRLMGYEPLYSFEDGLGLTVAYFQQLFTSPENP